MVLTSGPTGSGKSTSLYALIKEIKDESVNIVTLEDPVEYKMDGVNQIQVNADVGLTFAQRPSLNSSTRPEHHHGG